MPLTIVQRFTDHSSVPLLAERRRKRRCGVNQCLVRGQLKLLRKCVCMCVCVFARVACQAYRQKLLASHCRPRRRRDQTSKVQTNHVRVVREEMISTLAHAHTDRQLSLVVSYFAPAIDSTFACRQSCATQTSMRHRFDKSCSFFFCVCAHACHEKY